MKPNTHVNVGKAQENRTMMIFMLAAAMTVAMLIATAFGIHYEAQRVRMDDRNDRFTPYCRR
jgi:hypothetical protein